MMSISYYQIPIYAMPDVRQYGLLAGRDFYRTKPADTLKALLFSDLSEFHLVISYNEATTGTLPT
jgi:hypothetical protein